MTSDVPLSEFADQAESTNNQSKDDDSPVTERDPSTESLSAEEVTFDADELPDAYSWRDDITIHHDVAAVIPLAEETAFDVTTKTTGERIGRNQVGYILDGLNALKEISETVERVYPPSTYREFDEFNPHYAQVTTTFSSGLHGGWGITPEWFEAALRFVTGGGQYNASNMTVTALDFRIGWLFEHKGDAYLFAYTKTGQPTETIATVDVNGITVENEEDESVLRGIKHVMEVLPEVGIEITGFSKRKNNSLYFETDQDEPIKFTGKQLARVRTPTNDLAEYEGTHEIELFHQDETYEYTWEPGATKHEPGDVLERDGSTEKRLVLGYTRHMDRVQRGIRPNKYEAGTRVLARPWYLTVRPDAYDGRIDTRVYGSNGKETIAEVPYDVPDHPDPDNLNNVKLWNPQ